ncbi:type IV secretion system protein, VirB2 family [Anaplasma platys]|uniref:Type IV secretion system protein, VirB2 family n=1 Tax=Anaplasma platys TaxID=949 RepID=A0A858PZ07_9RICK|nr:TrbC/VirB2 family protein [Anaplasma platys]QJC27800.1 type IV secretion system protein, VirB2 family [Anaplasma platys]
MWSVARFFGLCSLFFLLIGASAQSSAENNNKDVAATVICNVVVFVQRLGLPIMTGVILGASIMAIFGKMAWASIVVLVVFTAIFFGAGKLMQKFAAGLNGEFSGANQFECKSGGTVIPSSSAAAA